MSTRLLGPKRQKSLFGWHQTLAWTGLSMLALHAGALLFDPTLHFGLALGPRAVRQRLAPGRGRRRRRRRLARRSCSRSRSGCASGSGSAAGGGSTTRASPRSSSRSGTRSRPAPTSRASAARSLVASPPGPVIWLSLRPDPASPHRTRRPPRDAGRHVTHGGRAGSPPATRSTPRRHGGPHERRTTMYRIQIDRSLCSGFGVCAELAPEVIDGRPGRARRAPHRPQRRPGRPRGGRVCPMAAITVAVEEAA